MTESLIHLETCLVLRLSNAENQDLGYMQYLILILVPTFLDNTSFQVCIGLKSLHTSYLQMQCES
jgi:hypothetical protein